MNAANATDDKTIVKNYFNGTGFDRWRRIYGDGEVNKVQKDIRQGHQQTIDTVFSWLEADGNLNQLSICDAGCGVGSLSIPLAQAGARVYGSDISEKMVTEAYRRAREAMRDTSNLTLMAQDLELLSGRFHTVICLDVLIHYPESQMTETIAHLASLAESRLILSFAPKTPVLTVLKAIGSLFPGPSKATRAYPHKEAGIVRILQDNGFAIQRRSMTSTRFYYSLILEAVRR